MSTLGGSTPLALRDHNSRLVYQALRNRRRATAGELAAEVGLTPVTVGTILQNLVARKAVFEGGLQSSTGGRPARAFRFNERFCLVAAVSTHEVAGRDTVEVRVCDLWGQPVESSVSTLPLGGLGTFYPLLDPLFERFPELRALGFALPGFEVDGVVAAHDYPGLIGTRLTDHFHRRYHLPVLFENDVNAAVWGRGLQPGAPASEAYVYFPARYRPGAGLRLEGRLIRGRGNFAGEVGHLRVDAPWTSVEAVAAVVRTLVSVAAPDAVVLHGEFLTDADLPAILAAACGGMPPAVVPELVLSQRFALDVQEGLVGLTWNLVDPLEVGPWPLGCS